MRIFERVGATILVVIVLVSVCAPCFASGAEVIAGIDAFSALYNAYLVARGFDAVGSTANVDWSSTDPAASEVTAELWQRFYDYWSPTVTGTNDTVDTWWLNHRAYMGSGYIDSNGTYHDGPPPSSEPDPVLGLGFSAQLVEFFDKLTSTVLKDQYDLTHTDSGFAHSGGSFDDPLSSVYAPGTLPVGSWSFVGYQNFNSRGNVYANPRSGPVYLAFYGSSSAAQFIAFSLSGDTVIDVRSDSGWTATWGTGWYNSAIQLYEFDASWGQGSNFQFPFFQDASAARSAAVAYFADPTSETGSLVRLQPSDKYLNSPIPVPDTDDPDYAAQPLQVPLNIPYITSFDNPDWTSSSDPAAQSIIDAVNTEVSTNTLEVLEPSEPVPPLESPSPVMPPFLPVDPPAAPFSFAGIWYYVVRWVNSCRAGMSWFFSIWTSLPAAMFYPVFGSAVAVIVIGTWRRFFE